MPRRDLVYAVLAALALQEDVAESETVFCGLCALLRGGDPELGPFIPRLLQVFGAFAAQEVPAEAAAAAGIARRDIRATPAASLCSPEGGRLRELLAILPPEHASALAALL